MFSQPKIANIGIEQLSIGHGHSIGLYSFPCQVECAVSEADVGVISFNCLALVETHSTLPTLQGNMSFDKGYRRVQARNFINIFYKKIRQENSTMSLDRTEE